MLDRAFVTLRRIGSQIIQQRKTALLSEHHYNGSAVLKQDVEGHDLLSLLIKSNIAADVPESMRMSDSEILSRECFPPCQGSVLYLKYGDNNLCSRNPHVPAGRS